MGAFDDLIPNSQSSTAGAFDDLIPKDAAPEGGFVAAAKQAIGAGIKGAGQVASDYIPGVTSDNPVSAYGQSVIDANPTSVTNLGGILESPWQATKEAVGNAAGSMGSMIGTRALGTGITAAAPFTGPAAPFVAGAGQLIANVGPFVAAALPSYGGIREEQIKANPLNEADAKSKAIAALGAGTVGAIEGSFGPQAWALAAMKKGGIEEVAKKFADAKSITGAIGKGFVKGASVEGAEEVVQNPIEQVASYRDPTTKEAISETLFGGAMGALGGGVAGGGISGAAYAISGPLSKAVAAAPAPTTAIDTVIPQPTTVIPANTVAPEQAATGVASAAQFPQFTAPPQPVTGGAPLEQAPTDMPVPQAIQNAPAAPGSTSPVSAADPLPSAKQAEAAGAPQQRVADLANRFEQAAQGLDDLSQFSQQEVADVRGRRAGIVAGQRTMREAKLEAADARVETARQKETEARRNAILDGVDLQGETNIVRRFEKALAQAGIAQNKATPADRERLARRVAAAEGLAQDYPPIPAAPNELLLPDRKASAASPSGRREQAIAALARQKGVRLKGTALIDANGRKRATLTPREIEAASGIVQIARGKDANQTEVAIPPAQGPEAAALPVAAKPASGIAAALQYPQQVTEGGGPLAQQAADMPLGRFGERPKTADISPDISPDIPAKKATRIASSSGIAGALVTPQQPTFGGAPLEQSPVAMPIGEFGKRAAVASRQTPPAEPKSSEWVGASVVFTSPSGRAKRGSVIRVTNGKAVVVSPVGQNYVDLADLKRSKAESTPLKGFPASDNSPGNVKSLDYARQELEQGSPHWYVANALADDVLGDNSKLTSAAFSYVREADSKKLWKLIDSVAKQLGEGASNNGDVRRATAYFVASQTPLGAPQARRQPQPAPIMRRDDLVGAIMRVTGGDGIASNMALTIAKENAGKNLPRLRGLFTNRGWEDLGEIATLLRNEEGFSVRDGEHLSQLIEQAASGTAQTGMARAELDLDADREARHRDYIRQNAKKLKIKSVAVKFSDLERRVIDALTRRHERAVELLDERAKKRFDAALEESYALLPEDVVDAVLVDVNGRGLKTLEFWKEATTLLRYMVEDAKAQKEQEAFDAIEGAEPGWLKDDDGRGNRPTGGGGETNRVVEEAGGEAGFDLAAQTPEEIAAAEAAAKEAKQAEAAAAAADARKEKAAQDKAEKDRRAAEVLKEREIAKIAEIDKALEDFALGQAAPEPVVKKVTTEEAKGQKDIFAAPAPVEPKPAAKEAINDFGEKLEGARKDYAAHMKDAMSVDVASEPLSKSWPEPDYQKLLDGGADPKTVAIVRAARDQVATKPLKAWKIKGWAPDVMTLRATANKLLNGEISRPQAEASFNVDGFNETARSIIGRAELYELVGHKMSLKGVSFAQHFYSLYKGQENVRKWVVEQKAKATVFSNWPRELAVGDTKEEALDAFKEKIASLDLGAGAKRQPQFVIYRKRGEPGAWVGKKIDREYIDLHKAADVAEARKYMAESLPALEAKLAKYKETPLERKADNQPRVGDDHRNGAPVTPEVFADTFGFRGVQFGNYVEQNRRQSDLNEAFDGLMDLAAVLGIPPRALSLNGQLGLAFGARGRGGKNAPAAHFETGRVVINLTKGGGPGSLAHEWWHSLDNYFAKQANKNSTEFVTAGARTDGVREAMRVAFNAVNLATSTKAYQARSSELDKRRSKPYWNTSEERSARAFEGYVIAKLFDQGAANDYLANVVSNEVWDITEDARVELFGAGKTPKTYPYPTVDEMPAVRAAFDEFFKTVETKESDDGNVVLFSQESPSFYSQLSSAIASARVTSQPAAQWKAWINGNAGNLGIKKDEIAWSGILDYLDVRGKDKVTKEEIADYLNGNGVRVEDAVKADPYVDYLGDNLAPRRGDQSKFSDYWQDSYKGGIPGTYREILVTLPARGDNGFKSNHWDEPNVLVHIRTDEVIGADGKRYLRVGEIQSDWGQKGKKEGFKGRSAAEIEADLIKIPDGDPSARALLDELKAARDGVQKAPFVTDTRAWAALGIKRAIIHAINSGVDGVVFGTGEQNANLYDLSKQVSRVAAKKSGESAYDVRVYGMDGMIVDRKKSIQADELEDYIGKDIAKRIIDDVENTGLADYQGLDLKVGGEGMRAFYDQIIPSVANDVLKKVGGVKVGSVEVEAGESKWWRETNGYRFGPFDTKREAQGQGRLYQEAESVEQPGFTITPQMRAKIQSQGVPLFSFAGQQSATADQFQLDRAKQLLADGANANSVRQQTGWFKNPSDGKWRYEIDDSGASLKAHGFGFGELLDALGKNLTLAEVLDHPALFAAYPSIAKSSVEAIDEKSQNNGDLVTNKDGGFTIRVNAGLGEAKALSVMLHEIQHGIQNVEGFASGGSMDQFVTPILRKKAELERRVSEINKLLSRSKGNEYLELLADRAEIVDEIRRLPDDIGTLEQGYKQYRKLAGEVESRNVQQRQNFPADKRRLSDPFGTQDVAPEDVIVMFNGKDAKDAPAPANTTRASAMAAVGASPADAAVFDMAAEGKSAQEILAFLSKASRRPFNRILASALMRIGVSSTVSVDPAAGWRNTQNRQGARFAASYSPKTDTVSLYTPREAERHALHEFVHAATLKAIARGGPAARQMQAVFDHVQKTGTMSDQYGMGNFARFPNETDAQFKKRALDEFTAELFTNPQFQVRLKQLPAPPGSKLKSAWDWIVRVIANMLGLKTREQETALDRALSVGAALLQENAELTDAQGGERFNQEQPFSGRGNIVQRLETATKNMKTGRVNSSRGTIHAITYADARKDAGLGQFVPPGLLVDGFYDPQEDVFYTREDAARLVGLDDMETNKLVQIQSSAGRLAPFSGREVAATPEDPDIRYSLATNWQQSPVAPGNLYQAAKKKAAGLLTPERLDKVIYETQDKFIDLRRVRDHIKEIGGTITDLNDAYLGEELYHKRLAYRTEQFLKEELQPFFADMKARGVEMPEFEKFLHARHAPEANDEMAKRNPNQKQIDAGRQKSAATVRALELNLQTAKARGLATVAIEKALNDARAELVRWNGAQAFKGTEAERLSLSGMSNAAAGALMASLTPAQRANMNALAAKVDAINEGTLQTLERYGLMDKAAMNAWRQTYKHYVPLHRDEAHPDSVSHPIGQGFNVRGDASKRRTGSNQEVTNIFSHIAMQREAALTRGEKNRVMQKLYLMARQNPIADIWSVGKVPMIDTIDKATGFVRSVPDPQYKDKPNVITLRIAGKDVAIVMNEYNPQALRLAQSIKNLDVDDLHYLIPVVGKATRWFASINTQYNPIFGLINFARDVQTAALNLSTTAIAGKQKEVFKDTMSILGDIIKNKGRMPTAGKWAPIYKEFNEVGGTTGYRDLFLTAEDRSKAVTDEIKALDRGKISQAAHAVAGWLSDYNEAMENATRLAAYKAAIDNGMSKERAASLAKNLTVNFNRKGRQTRELGALYAFFNAAVQGTARMAQTLSGPAGKKIMLGGVLAGAASAMAGIAAMGGGDGEDDEWSKIPEFVKERSFIIPAGNDKYIAIPMPLGFHFLPNIGRLMVEMAVYKDKTIGKQMASIFTVLADAFNPLGGSAPPMQIIAPTVMDPFIALAQNKDWTGKPIYVENFNSLNPQPGAARAKDSATPMAKGLADAINAVTGGTKYVPGGWSPTPDQIDYVIGQLTGGVGRELGKLSSTIAAHFTGDELPAHKIPLLGRLYGSTAGATGQAGKFYENIKRANEVENELKGRRKDGISVDDYLQDNPRAVELAARGNAAERQIRALRQMRSRIVEAGGDDAASKARQINERMATVMRGFNMQVERMQ